MPSVSVPLKGAPGWNELMLQRRAYWARDKNDELEDHFRATEFFCNDGTPCPIVSRPALVRLCRQYLEPLRASYGVAYVLSGYRHELWNVQIGGARYSQHVYEHNFESVAADVRFARGNPGLWAAKARTLRELGGGNGGIGVYPRAGFLHVDNRGYKADWSG